MRLIFLLALILSCSTSQPDRISKNDRCEDAIKTIPTNNTPSFLKETKTASKTIASYVLTGLTYGTEVTVYLTGGIAAGIVICSPIIAAESAAKGTGQASGACLRAVSEAILRSLPTESEELYGTKVYNKTSHWRCPDLSDVSAQIRSIASCYENKGDIENLYKSKEQLDVLLNADFQSLCVNPTERKHIVEQSDRVEVKIKTLPRPPANLHIVGTVHNMNLDEGFTERDFSTLLEKLHPDILLLEYPLDWFNRDGTPTPGTLRIMTSTDEKKDGRDGQLAWAYCQNHSIPCLPYDISGRNNFFKSKRIYPRMNAVQKVSDDYAITTPAYKKKKDALDENYNRCLKGTVAQINSDECDRISKTTWDERKKMEGELDRQGLLEDPSYMDDFWGFWDHRNASMAQTICEIASRHPKKTIVAIMGFAHRHLLKKEMAKCQYVLLKDF